MAITTDPNLAWKADHALSFKTYLYIYDSMFFRRYSHFRIRRTIPTCFRTNEDVSIELQAGPPLRFVWFQAISKRPDLLFVKRDRYDIGKISMRPIQIGNSNVTCHDFE